MTTRNGAARPASRLISPEWREQADNRMDRIEADLKEVKDLQREHGIAFKRHARDTSEQLARMGHSLESFVSAMEKLGDLPDHIARTRMTWRAVTWAAANIRKLVLWTVPFIAGVAYLVAWYVTGSPPLP